METNRQTIKKRRKQDLLAASKSHQAALYKELSISSDRVVEYGKSMALIGGALYVGYTILDRFLDAKLKTEKKGKASGKYETLNKMILPLLAMALQQGSMLLLKKVRTKLVDYLEEKSNKDV